ncbi:hypothetical protein QJQ45_001862 [Haematococcus lacustris]|nr:hypothetical protein QJQ45_001862 [Haematococcus lacustris]
MLPVSRTCTATSAPAKPSGDRARFTLVLSRESQANVLLSASPSDARGYTAQLADFGLARALQPGQGITFQGKSTVGTASYMSPEALLEGKLSYQSDIFSLGMCLFEMVHGVGAHDGHSMREFQSEWLEGREMWLVVFGLQGNLYRVRCTACDLVINSHLHTIEKHEDSARHKQNLAAKQKSSAAVQAFKAALTTGRDRTAAKRKEQMEDPATVTQFAAVFYLLKLGIPMTDIEHTPTSSESPGLQPLQPSTGKTTTHGRLQRPFTLSCASMTWEVLLSALHSDLPQWQAPDEAQLPGLKSIYFRCIAEPPEDRPSASDLVAALTQLERAARAEAQQEMRQLGPQAAAQAAGQGPTPHPLPGPTE